MEKRRTRAINSLFVTVKRKATLGERLEEHGKREASRAEIETGVSPDPSSSVLFMAGMLRALYQGSE